MKPEHLGKTIALAFLAALILYAASFMWIEHTRHRKGPWEMTFLTDDAGTPMLLISQPAFGIRDVKLIFPEERLDQINLARPVRFDDPKPIAPFGRIIAHDLTFLPGTQVFDFFEHEVEVVPRALTIDKKEHPWKSEAVIEIQRDGRVLHNGPGQ
jgi:hypothetical protein